MLSARCGGIVYVQVRGQPLVYGSKFTLEQVRKDQKGSRGLALLLL